MDTKLEDGGGWPWPLKKNFFTASLSNACYFYDIHNLEPRKTANIHILVNIFFMTFILHLILRAEAMEAAKGPTQVSDNFNIII